jgi:hypothetical protein
MNNQNHFIKHKEENATNYDQPLNEETCERYKFLNELDYFEDILGSYNYSEDKIDDEVIARFVQVIAKYKFEPSIMHIIEPMEVFWQDAIHPFTEELSQFYEINNMCFPMEHSEYL